MWEDSHAKCITSIICDALQSIAGCGRKKRKIPASVVTDQLLYNIGSYVCTSRL